MQRIKKLDKWKFEDDFKNEVYWDFYKNNNDTLSRLEFLFNFTSILHENNITYALYSDTKKELIKNIDLNKQLVFDEIVISRNNINLLLNIIQNLDLKVKRDKYGRVIVQNKNRLIKITLTYLNIKKYDLNYIEIHKKKLYFLDKPLKNKIIGKVSLIYLEYVLKKIIKLITNFLHKKKNKNFELKKIELNEFLNLNIETKNSINWILRKPHLDLVTKNGKNRKVKQIINYFQKMENMEMALSKLIITDTSKPFELPVQINEKFWLKGNNFFILPMIFQFRKDVIPYEEVNDYILKDIKPMLYSQEYYKNLLPMKENEIEEFLKNNPIEITDKTITSGRHRTLAMIGRLIEGKQYLHFFAYVK